MATTRTRLHAVASTAAQAVTNRVAAVRAGSTTRTRLRAVGVGAALAFMVGLSGPVATAATSATTPDVQPQAVTEAAAAVIDAATGVEPAAAAPADAAPAAPAAAPAPAAPAAAPAPAAPAEADLYPVGMTGDQQRFVPSQEQMSNARAIVDAAKAMGLPPRAWVIGVSTALQESNLKNLGDLGARNDHDSLGLFQQRPSSGWGTPEQINDPTYSATAFFQGLNKVTNWHTMPVTVAAQKVQVSAFPDHYAKHESEAGDIIRGLYGQGPFAGIGG